jgi:trehalose 6-phosphate synthase
MTLVHTNRIRKAGGKQLVRELAAEELAAVLTEAAAGRAATETPAQDEAGRRLVPEPTAGRRTFGRIVVISNRLPVVIETDEQGTRAHPGSGGLVTALAPILRQWGGLWIGWPGSAPGEEVEVERLLAGFNHSLGYSMTPVHLSPQERNGFYQGFSNEIIWPLFHDLQSSCNFVPEYWNAYQAVKEKFAEVVVQEVQPDDFVWVNDYHLMGLGRRLRERGVHNKLGFFLHIPFPPPDIFCKLPWRTDVLEGLLTHDVVGFQTPRDLENFNDCVRRLLPKARRRRSRGTLEVTHRRSTCSVGAFPIGIDFDEFAVPAASPEVAERARQLRADMQDQQVILGLDRLDYTKDIPYRLRAFRLALQRYPELHRAVTLLQVVIPSRQGVPEYQDLKAQIERLVSEINGEFTQPGWVPIHHVFRSLERADLLAYYRLADAALITPLKDGMNLVAKEYCACQVDGNGVLILSEFAGAAVQLGRHAVLVNPYDLDRVAGAIRHAVLMTKAERGPAMGRMRAILRRQDVYWWVNRFLAACGVDAPAERAGAASRAG